MAAIFSFQIDGLKPLLDRLAKLPGKVKKKVLRDAVRKAMRPVLTAAKAKCPVNLGWLKKAGLDKVLKKSLAMKISTSRKTGLVSGIVGPRRGMKMVANSQTGKRQRQATKFSRTGATSTGRTVTINPTAIAHLVEFGHGGPHPAGPHAFIRPAWDENKAAAEATLRSMILDGIEREART